jgi:hypothetical protein
MISTVTKPKNKQELLTQLQRKNPLKFDVVEYTDQSSKSAVNKAIDQASRNKGQFTVLIIHN